MHKKLQPAGTPARHDLYQSLKRALKQGLPPLTLSIRAKILFALLIVVSLMVLPYIFLVVPGLQYKREYDSIIQNITEANSISGSVKTSIDDEMWTVITGKKTFGEGLQYQILSDVESRVAQMLSNTDSRRGQLKLKVIQRTLATLREQIDRTGMHIAEGKTFKETMPLMESIRAISQMVEENVQAYALFEVNRTEERYQEMQASLERWALGGLGMLLAALLFSISAAWRISKSIYAPIKKLHDVTSTIARQDLEALVTADNADEITDLRINFNIMVGKIRELLEAKITEQENLKKAELRALQAQINPHFLYNTLDTIIWMAEEKRSEQVVELVGALSRFFRISLSKGKDWITIEEEIQHIESYLAIQRMRYEDILDYEISMPQHGLSGQMLKLTLQPLVENALYHGIKNKRGGGMIRISGRTLDEQHLLIEVADNGIGIPPGRLALIQDLLAGKEKHVRLGETGYGLDNVNQRLTLYYGQEYGLSIKSEYLAGTTVSFVVPHKLQDHRKHRRFRMLRPGDDDAEPGVADHADPAAPAQ